MNIRNVTLLQACLLTAMRVASPADVVEQRKMDLEQTKLETSWKPVKKVTSTSKTKRRLKEKLAAKSKRKNKE